MDIVDWKIEERIIEMERDKRVIEEIGIIVLMKVDMMKVNDNVVIIEYELKLNNRIIE